MLTIAIETSVLLLILRKKYGTFVIARNSVVASSLTLPFVWFVFPNLGIGQWVVYTALAEMFAFLAEAGVYRLLFKNMDWENALAASFACNAASFLSGMLAALAFG